MEWISVKDRLPEIVKLVLVTDGKATFYGWLMQGTTRTADGEYVKMWVVPFRQFEDAWYIENRSPIAHWMPLPEPPKEADND